MFLTVKLHSLLLDINTFMQLHREPRNIPKHYIALYVIEVAFELLGHKLVIF